MKIYNMRCNRSSNRFLNDSKNGKSKKEYKRKSANGTGVIQSSVSNGGRQKISSKDRKLLEGLGLKVKQSIENS